MQLSVQKLSIIIVIGKVRYFLQVDHNITIGSFPSGVIEGSGHVITPIRVTFNHVVIILLIYRSWEGFNDILDVYR